MKLKPGCGCLVLVLGVLDLLLAVRALFAVVGGSAESPTMAFVFLAVLGSNFFVCLATGWAAIRGQRADQGDSLDTEKGGHAGLEGLEGEEAEKEDED